ncbi:hypothetical protein [Deinococcus aquatilis]|uniref:hypothetical protein n=1 Tax=Deinococcus aquatilis TaxID=519440 RepID=UPI001B7FEAB5|nr:hypothetical protein [Deinococcus aquatilis]
MKRVKTELESTGNRSGTSHYEIRLQGHLDQRWATRFLGLSFTHEQDGTTTLSGVVIDQAALHGLLRTVRDLGLPLIAVTRLNYRAPMTPETGSDCTGPHPGKEDKEHRT